ncbi:MAG: hypothetical protein AAF481_01955 [Acidobacteriota bacterium]
MPPRTDPEPNAEILLAGGDADPNLATLLARLQDRRLSCQSLLVGARSHPRVSWDLSSDELWVDGQPCRPRAVFVRHDVFTSLAERRPEPGYRAMAWFTALGGWLLAHPEVRLLNRESFQRVTNKLQVLDLARRLGLATPRTLVSNDRELLLERVKEAPLVVKPVNGGDFTRPLEDVLPAASHRDGALASPSIIQQRLVPPEVRVYGIAGGFFAFHLQADALDYRSTADCKVLPVGLDTLPDSLLERLGALMERLGLNFGAADFKADADSGELLFLEINNGPMFAAFDAAGEGCLTGAMADFLAGG